MGKNRLSIGLLILIISLIADHYFTALDFLPGVLKGFAIGILLLILLKNLPWKKLDKFGFGTKAF